MASVVVVTGTVTGTVGTVTGTVGAVVGTVGTVTGTVGTDTGGTVTGTVGTWTVGRVVGTLGTLIPGTVGTVTPAPVEAAHWITPLTVPSTELGSSGGSVVLAVGQVPGLAPAADAPVAPDRPAGAP
jgi:hypothetical protein